MKWLVIVLLLAGNLIYFGWELDRDTQMFVKNNSEVLRVPSGVKRLQLLRETSRATPADATEMARRPSDPPGSVPDNAPSGTDVMIESSVVDELLVAIPPIQTTNTELAPGNARRSCFAYGPFPDRDQAIELLRWFQDQDVEVRQRFEQDNEKPLFWIYLAPGESRDSAIRAIESLKQQGVSDYRLIETGSLQNAISLGLFSTQASVNRRLNELKDKGYQPVVVPYRDTDAIYWIDVRVSNNALVLTEMFTGYPARFNSVPVNCSEIALQ